MKNLLKYFNGYKKESVLAPLLKLAEALLELWTPTLVAYVIDRAIPTGEARNVYTYIGLMFLTATIGFICAIIAQYFSAKAATGYSKNLGKDLYQHIINLSQSQRDKLGSSTLVNALTSDMTRIETGLNMVFRLMLRSPFIVFGSLIMAMRLDMRMTINFVTLIIILFVIVVGIMKITNPLHSQIRQSMDKLVTLSREQMQGMRVIRAFRQTEREVNDFREVNEDLTKEQKRTGWIDSLVNPLTYFAVNVALIIIIQKGSNFISVGSLKQGELVALINYLSQILVELVKITYFVSLLNRAIVSASRINTIMEAPVESDEVENNEEIIKDSDTAFKTENLEFSYPLANKPSLEDINISVNKGDFIGIIGGTGSGKTTLLNLITKLYEPSSGQLAYNSSFFNLDSKTSLRENISVVPGQVDLFKGTIRSNLLLAKRDASDEEMWQALEDAQAKDFVEQLDDGLDSEVAAFGRNFSGGQRQRLTIARALLKKALVYVFDDSTSALDYLTEAKLQKTLAEKYSDKIIIMISQRTRSLLNADQILVLDHGKQVGLGKHNDLLEDCQVYQEIHQSQLVEEVE